MDWCGGRLGKQEEGRGGEREIEGKERMKERRRGG